MGWIIISRNPRTQKLIAITSSEERDDIAEFGTESEAKAVAMAVPLCEAWGFEAVEVSLTSGQGK